MENVTLVKYPAFCCPECRQPLGLDGSNEDDTVGFYTHYESEKSATCKLKDKEFIYQLEKVVAFMDDKSPREHPEEKKKRSRVN